MSNVAAELSKMNLTKILCGKPITAGNILVLVADWTVSLGQLYKCYFSQMLKFEYLQTDVVQNQNFSVDKHAHS